MDEVFNKILGKHLIKIKTKDERKQFLDTELPRLGTRALELSDAANTISKNFKEILETLSTVFPLNLSDPNLIGTPDRLGRSWIEMLSGLGIDDRDVFSTSFPSEKYDQIIVLDNISYNSLCSHHFLHFSGKVTIGYLPSADEGKVCGVSKLARVVDVHAKRPQLQERMCNSILDAIDLNLKPRGAIVVITGTHSCMGCRGIEKTGTNMITSAVSGSFTDVGLKHEFFELLKVHKS